MRQFLVPQFIDVEDKIFLFITVRQFIIIVIGGGIDFILYRFFDFYTFLAFGVPIAVITGVIAFAVVNGRPIHYFLLTFLESLIRPHIRVWSKSYIAAEVNGELHRKSDKEVIVPVYYKESLKKSRLAELSLVVDTGGQYGEDEEVAKKTPEINQT